MRALFARWRELAIVAALIGCYLLGRRAVHSASAVDAWKDSTTIARADADSAKARWHRAQLVSDAAKPDLDSARASWLALRPVDPMRCTVCDYAHNRILAPARDTLAAVTEPELDAAIAHAAAATDSELAAAGDHLERACTAYESACETAKRAAAAAIDSLQGVIDLQARRPPNPAAARFQPRLGAGYSPLEGWPVLRADASLRIAGPWYLTGELTQPLHPGEQLRGAVMLMWRF